MGSLAVNAKITASVKSSPAIFFPRRLVRFYASTGRNIPKHVHSLLPVKQISSFANFSNDFYMFDKMSNRQKCSEITQYYDVLDLVKFSSMKPNIVIATIVHSLALKLGALAHLPSSTSLLINYSRAGDFQSSVALFSEIAYKDVVIWNAMMTTAVENKSYQDALNFFVQMIKEESGFDSATLVIVISVLSIMKKLIQGWALHGLSVKAGMISDPFLCNALISMYAKCGDLTSSESMFVNLEFRDLISWNSMISSCLHNDQPEKSLGYFKKMTSFRKLADNVSLSCAIAACTCLEELDAGQAIHGWVIKLGYEESSQISVANSLISFYSECGDINSALSIFGGLLRKDLISWNAMIDGFASNGLILEASDCLNEMQLAGCIQPDTVTLLTLLPLCAELKLSLEGRSIHGFVIRRELGLELSLTNCLMDMYMKSNSVKEAEYVFQAMPEGDLVTWNTMISGYSQNGHSKKAQTLFKELLCWCSRCSLSTLLGILPSCNSPASLEFGKSVHGWQLKLGFLNKILALNSLMLMYINCGDLQSCFLLLGRNCAIADTACWNAVIAGCAQNAYYLDALRTFNLMRRESNVNHDSITLVNVISACGNFELVLEGKLCHGLALKTLVSADIRVNNALITMYSRFGETHSARLVFDFCHYRNLCSWNCMISALSQNKYAKEALELFHFLDVEPNEITIATILSACTQLGLTRYGKQIHGRSFRFQFHRNSFVTSALVDMYSNCGRFERALKVFEHSPEKSVAAWNSMISAYGFHSKGQGAIKIFHEMMEYGISPTKSTFISLLSACSHVGLVNEGLWYYDHMVDEYGVQPVTEHHVCMVDLLGRAGRLNDAYEFIKNMKSQPEPGLWGALLSACNYHGNVEMGREVADILFDLEPENVGYYISLSNMYVAAGRWSNAVEMRTIIQDKRLKKPAGYSVLDIGLG